MEESLEDIKDEIASSDALIYVFKEHNDEEVLNIISKKLGLSEFDFIADTYQSRIYYGY